MTRQTKNDPNSQNNKAAPSITLNVDLYAQYLEGTDLTEDQKREFLDTLWNIICEFVALGFNVHPVQQAQSACGKLPDTAASPPILGADAVEWTDQTLKAEFKVSATDKPASAEEGIEG